MPDLEVLLCFLAYNLARFADECICFNSLKNLSRNRLDLSGFVELAEFHYDEEEYFYSLKAKELTKKFFPRRSIGYRYSKRSNGSFSQRKTRIYNAVCEPYLQQLCKMLNRMGANISGIGSNLLTIEGVSHLRGTEHTMLPDMVEIGSLDWSCCNDKIEMTIKNVNWNQLGLF